MPPQGMDWQQPPHHQGGSQWRENQSYYESRQQQQQQQPPYSRGGSAPTSPYPPQYRISRPPPVDYRRVTPSEGYKQGVRGAPPYYERGGWREQQQPQRHTSPPRPTQQQRLPPPPYRVPEERPYMPLHEEMRMQEYPQPDGPPQPPPPPSLRIQFRPNVHRRQPSHPLRGVPSPPKSPPKKEKASEASDSKKEKEKKDKDALSLLAKVSFDIQTSPQGSPKGSDREDNPGEEKTKDEEKRVPERKQPEGPTSPPQQRMPTASPLVAPQAKDASPVSPECWTPKASNASPRHRRGGSGILRTPHVHATPPMITPASSVPTTMTPRHHRRHSSVDSLYHQRWTSFAEGPVTPGAARSPYPHPGGLTPEYAPPDYLTMEHIATPPQRTGSPQRSYRGAAQPPASYYSQPQGWDRSGGGPPPSSDPSGWGAREAYPQRYPEEYPHAIGRAPSYEEEGPPPPPPPRYARYPPPEAYGGEEQDYYAWREQPPQYEGHPGAYKAPYPQGQYRQGPYSAPPHHRPYSHHHHQGPPPFPHEHQDVRYHQHPTPAQQQQPEHPQPYTYVQQPQLDEKVILRKKFSWKHYPELERFLVSHRDEYLRHSALNYTAEQKQYNNWLTESLLELAAQHNYEFDPAEFNFVAVRDRIRCYYKSYVQTARKRGISFPGLKSPTTTKKPRKDEASAQDEQPVESVPQESVPQEDSVAGDGSAAPAGSKEEEAVVAAEPNKDEEAANVEDDTTPEPTVRGAEGEASQTQDGEAVPQEDQHS